MKHEKKRTDVLQPTADMYAVVRRNTVIKTRESPIL